MNDTEIEELIKTNKTLPNISENLFKHLPDNLDLIFSTLKKYEEKKIKINKSELYVGNLDRYLTYDEIHDFLTQFGELETLKMNYDNKNSHPKKNKQIFLGNCFVKYKNLETHDKLLSFSNYYSLRNRKIIFSEKLEKIQTLDDIEKSCWFCFNNPLIEKDLIIKEFNNFYIAYPKGPIDNFHIIILPKFHIESYVQIPVELYEEFQNIFKILKKFFFDNNLEYIIYEKNLPYKDEKAKHMLMNIVGIKKELSFQTFNHIYEYLSDKKIKFESFNSVEWDLSELKKETKDYYYHYIEIPSGISLGSVEKRTRILIKHENRNTQGNNKNDFIDISRLIICDLIDKKENINWKVYIFY